MSNNNFFPTGQEYNKNSDEELIELIKNGDEMALEYLINKYKDMVNMKVGKYFIIGAEREDIIQEGMIGLYKAIKSYNADKQNSFKSFANLCIERREFDTLHKLLKALFIGIMYFFSKFSIFFDGFSCVLLRVVV